MAIIIYNFLGTGRPKLTMELAGSGVTWPQAKSSIRASPKRGGGGSRKAMVIVERI